MFSRRCQLRMSSGTLYRVELARTDVSKNASSPCSGLIKLIRFYRCIGWKRCYLAKPINLRNPEDGDDTFSESSVRASATRCEVPEDVFKFTFTLPFIS
jgi:hypothetical protein